MKQTMKHPPRLSLLSILPACILAVAISAVRAADSSPAPASAPVGTTAAVGASANTEAKLAAEFAPFLGGEERARTVISGLRQGTAFSLVTETTTSGPNGTPTTTTTTTTIDPPTGTLGYGNVRITLRLAQAELARLGIAQPTPEQLSAILTGGTINGSQVNGVLALRAEGMGWGQIARQYGLTVGQIMGKGAAMPAATGAKTVGKPASPAARPNGYLPSGKGAGIVSGSGSSVGASAKDGGKGQPGAVNAGVGSAGGPPASAGGASNAAGGASGSATGQVKKD